MMGIPRKQWSIDSEQVHPAAYLIHQMHYPGRSDDAGRFETNWYTIVFSYLQSKQPSGLN
ncbi:hypothetical protein M2272_000712 [Mycobacterium frederiksbergense]|uniref:Uncharacterized protein n=1 Tax=Mycolicibacterium frederiksbergense TaxID=117567 RepID=A0ABT6KTQ9_9MYCO|nr:hypothetical protein [Mycolicibacterium frederiksbergense]